METQLKLYYTANCNFCAIAVNALSAYGADCLLLPHVAHEKEVQELGDGVVPFLVDGDDIVFGSQSIVAHLSDKFELVKDSATKAESK